MPQDVNHQTSWFKGHSRGILTILVFALFMFLSFSLAFVYKLQLDEEAYRLEREVRENERELDRLRTEEKALQHRLPAIDSPAYVEEVARQQLNMVYEGDRIFVESRD